jgi:hypothetical protein
VVCWHPFTSTGAGEPASSCHGSTHTATAASGLLASGLGGAWEEAHAVAQMTNPATRPTLAVRPWSSIHREDSSGSAQGTRGSRAGGSGVALRDALTLRTSTRVRAWASRPCHRGCACKPLPRSIPTSDRASVRSIGHERRLTASRYVGSSARAPGNHRSASAGAVATAGSRRALRVHGAGARGWSRSWLCEPLSVQQQGGRRRPVGFLSIRVDVKAQPLPPSEVVVLTSGVRVTAREVVSGGETLRDVPGTLVGGQHAWLLGRDAVQGGETDCAVGIEAESFWRVEREPSFYRGF